MHLARRNQLQHTIPLYARICFVKQKRPPDNARLPERSRCCVVKLCLAGGHFYIGGADFIQGSANSGTDFARLSMASHFFLAEDALAIDPNIKDAAAARHQLPTTDEILDLALVQDFVRQTDGLGLVSSSGAVFDDNLHNPVLHDATSLQQLFAFDKATITASRWQIKRAAARRPGEFKTSVSIFRACPANQRIHD